MKLLIETTPEHDKALAELNALSNEGQAIPPVEEFAASELVGHLDSLVKNQDVVRVTALTEKMKGADATKIDAITAILG